MAVIRVFLVIGLILADLDDTMGFLRKREKSEQELDNEAREAVFNQLDTDQDGYLSLEELQTGYGSTTDGVKEKIARDLDKADTNEDGYLEFDEFNPTH